MIPKRVSVLLFLALGILAISLSSPGSMLSLSLPRVDLPDIWSSSRVEFSRAQYDLGDSAKQREGVQSKTTREPQEMTSEVYEKLNSLVFPRPSGQFVMDGRLDTSAVLLSLNGRIHLYAAIRGSQLYVATNASRSQHGDMFVFVSVSPGELRDAPSGKTGRVAAWSGFLGSRWADTSASWYDESGSPLTNIVDEKVGSVLEGVVDIELLTDISPKMVYLAVGKYKKGDRGRLLQQVPAGNHNGNIDPAEFFQFNIDDAR